MILFHTVHLGLFCKCNFYPYVLSMEQLQAHFYSISSTLFKLTLLFPKKQQENLPSYE